MDYTTRANVRASLGAETTTDDALIDRLIIEASRAIDKKVTGNPSVVDYFKSETKTDELLVGQVDQRGRILCHPRKPVVTSVTVAAYRSDPRNDWVALNTDQITIDGYAVTLWADLMARGKMQVKLTYVGGFATSTSGLPGDIVNVGDVMTVRFYRELKSNLSDAIGVAELGQFMYTKAWPVRALDMLKPYMRVIS